MSDMIPARILVIDDNTAIHEDFRKVFDTGYGVLAPYDQAAAALFRRTPKPKEGASMHLDFATQGREGLVLVQRALEAGQPYAMAFVDMRMPPGWDGIETTVQISKAQPELMVVICTAFSDYSWAEINQRLGHSDRVLILKKPFDNVEIRQFAHALTARVGAERKLKAAQEQLLEASRLAGMADVARGVLHHVGNVLNSLNVSSALVAERLREFRIASLAKAVQLLRDHKDDVGEFLTRDPKGQQLPAFLEMLSDQLTREQAGLTREMGDLQQKIEQINQIVAAQKSYARSSGVLETLSLRELVEDALRMASIAPESQIDVVRQFETVPPLRADRHQVLQILINVIDNAKRALDQRPEGRRLGLRIASGDAGCVRVEVMDNGVGIARENLTRVFQPRFTKKTNHSIGLHDGANAAREMGGSLRVHSAGAGAGATFILELPLGTTDAQRPS